jgi:hypothetical protein
MQGWSNMNLFFSKPLSDLKLASSIKQKNLGIAHMMKHPFSMELKWQGIPCACFDFHFRPLLAVAKQAVVCLSCLRFVVCVCVRERERERGA